MPRARVRPGRSERSRCVRQTLRTQAQGAWPKENPNTAAKHTPSLVIPTPLTSCALSSPTCCVLLLIKAGTQRRGTQRSNRHLGQRVGAREHVCPVVLCRSSSHTRQVQNRGLRHRHCTHTHAHATHTPYMHTQTRGAGAAAPVSAAVLE